MKNLHNNILELIGNTPLVKINRLNEDGQTDIYAKIEYFNPGGSVKDRIAYNMIQDALDSGKITKDSVLVEPTSGNTGIGLSMVAAALGMKIIIVMPESMSVERRKIIQGYGAQLVLTSAAGGMRESIEIAKKLVSENDNYYLLQQFENPANPDAHYKKTAEEIWNDTDGEVAVVVSAVGTGGTISGVGMNLKEKNPAIRMIAVEAAASPVLSGGKPGPHKIQGISAGFIPDVYASRIVDEIMQVTDEEALQTARNMMQKEGMPVGISSGAAMSAALKLAKMDKYKDKMIVVIQADNAERYLSTALFE
ncbi:MULTISPECIES: cysteine synthase A [unclassified Breznakia]|uniref:cysteine synthase A n=1 Tax=unclassified Breznakia TaxID=2623764 RepID=UPI0024770072|nr:MULTISPECIES: cysteine synthase A [unclassified Breznakia]MDH6366397.1 cysteine synthase A [Breznakia sp. PH1-1]MDH6403490.1 cysteine synthase A [Breznakia sp. PF1-11]MDH6411199.1 cysteine synthase A [Breznakia sp. PFB1-11]MDH6413538.1 cysteine synthase A [Breznakia sp. PFB1-14]MDH6415744.1 cysteine synthase A [Breznakia sp. PFB1-4]